MKKSTLFKLLLSVLVLPLTLVSCGDLNSSPTEPNVNDSSTEIEESTSQKESSSLVESTTPEENYQVVTIAEAIEIAKQSGNIATEAIYLLTATVDEMLNASYGEMNLSDETGTIYAFGVHGKNDEFFDKLSERPGEGDIVTLLVSLKMYNDKPEIAMGYLQSFEDVPEPEIDYSSYTEMTIEEARSAQIDSKIIIEGTIAHITHSFGNVPSGVYVVNNGKSIYVYSSEIAGKVTLGNNVKIAGNKTYYILSDEVNNANKHGYQGMCQIDEAELVSKDNSTVSFDKSNIEESTIKEILETPFEENITTQIFKVNSYINKVQGSGFVNYYLNDIDGSTGSYAYSQCNGSDYAWLDQYHGKICTVYLAAHNAKATATDCFYRFVPIAVSYDNYSFDTTKAPEYALEYHAVGQFESSYSANPNLEVISSVSSELLGFENVVLSYSTNNNQVAYFETKDGKTYFNTLKAGEVIVTITAEYGEIIKTATVEITVSSSEEVSTISVKDAIDTADGTEVIVKGIVAGGLVNQVGFYLVDETGLIPVRVATADVLEGIKVGHEVIVTGSKLHVKKDPSYANAGTNCINNATVENLFGSNEHSTASFITKSFDEIVTLASDVTLDLAAQGYITTGKISKVVGGYSTNYYLQTEDGSKQIQFYAGSGNQYSWLDTYAGQVVTIEIALCDWNSKKDGYRLCAIAIVTQDGKVHNLNNLSQ